MQIAIAQLNIHIGNFESNKRKILNAIEEAQKQGADLICFSELATTGYPPLDLLDYPYFIEQANQLLNDVKMASGRIGVLIGAPRVNPELPGKNLYNSAFFFYEQKEIGFIDKALLPTYDVFDEYRYFEPAKSFRVFDFKGEKLAVTICEDIWDIIQDDPIYTFHPMDILMEYEPTLAINLSASPFHQDQRLERKKVLKANATRYDLPFFYINHVGAQTDLIFDGGSLVVGPSGEVFEEMPFFRESIKTFSLKELRERDGIGQVKPAERIEAIHNALVFGVKDFFSKLGFSKAILGLSGGLDSALVAAIACKSLGSENVHGLIMPSAFSSESSVRDAVELASRLKMTYDVIAIDQLYRGFVSELSRAFGETPFDVTEENLQARIRGMLLMAYSNKKGYVLLNTTNKSEMAVGYGTLYGDLCGSLSVIGDVYKTDVYLLAGFINRDQSFIPQSSILKPPSAELRPDQKDTDSLPDYALLDSILKLFIEKRKSVDEIAEKGFDKELVKKVVRLVNSSDFKRYQTAPVLRVSKKAFGYGRRMPLVAKA
ncbi:MAG: NAD+ synthase [Saprospirales bacterium]|nr:MAG: NAD+ synthase [Saprospirales bacterium]